MEFVNSIAKIVHMEVALHGGSANKNIGDAFLLVWKFDPDCSLRDVAYLSKGLEQKNNVDAKDQAKVRIIPLLLLFLTLHSARTHNPRRGGCA